MQLRHYNDTVGCDCFPCLQALQLERAQREKREREIRAMEREVESSRASVASRRSDAESAASMAAEREAIRHQHSVHSRRGEDDERRRVHGEVDDVLRAVGGPPNKALPSILTPLGSGKPPSRHSTRSTSEFDEPSGVVDRASSEPVSLGAARPGGPVVRDVFAMPRGGGGSSAALAKPNPRLSASPSSAVDLRDSDRPRRGRSSASPPSEDMDVHVRYSSAQSADRFEHMSARDKVLARKQDERMKQEEQRKRDLAKAAQAAYADRAFAAQKEAEQYRGVEAAKASAFGNISTVSPRNRILLPEEDKGIAGKLKLPGARYEEVDDVDADSAAAYVQDVQYSLGSGGGGGGGSAGGYRSRERSPASRPPVPGGFVLPGSDAEFGEGRGRRVEDVLEIDTDDSDVPVGSDGDYVEDGKRALAPPDDDEELDAVEEELRNELGE